jgi:hypothetical protein
MAAWPRKEMKSPRLLAEVGLIKKQKLLSTPSVRVANAYVPLYIEICWDN